MAHSPRLKRPTAFFGGAYSVPIRDLFWARLHRYNNSMLESLGVAPIVETLSASHDRYPLMNRPHPSLSCYFAFSCIYLLDPRKSIISLKESVMEYSNAIVPGVVRPISVTKPLGVLPTFDDRSGPLCGGGPVLSCLAAVASVLE